MPRLYTAPHHLGHRPAVYIGVLDGVSQQLILVIAAVIAWNLAASRPLSSTAGVMARWAFGLCSINFGLGHLTDIAGTARMVPKAMPLGGSFWTVFTGIVFLIAGVAIVSGMRDVLAARLLGWMFLVFCVVALTPIIVAAPHDHTTWGGNAYTLTAAGAAWIFAEWLARRSHALQENKIPIPGDPSIAH